VLGMNMMTTPNPPPVHGVDGFEVEFACAARFDSSVLISGLDDDEDRAVAEAIHRRSRRAIAPFIAVNCARLSQACVESKLFGHAPDRAGNVDRGCFELAHGGTIFLAKLDTIGFTLQGRLLEFLETGDIRRVGESCVHRKVDVRVIASADNGPSTGWLARGLREDLFYRLNIIHLVVPFRRRDDHLYRQWLATRRLQTVCA